MIINIKSYSNKISKEPLDKDCGKFKKSGQQRDDQMVRAK